MKSLNVLITAASRRVALVQAFQSALAAAGGRGRVIVTDVNPYSAAVHVADRWYFVPMASDPSYIDAVLGICEEEEIGLVVPTIDDELEVFGLARARFEGRDIQVAVSDESTSRICRDKYMTCHMLRASNVDAAETFLPAELPPDPRLPLFIKPRFGRGSVGAFPIRSRRELDFFLGYVEDPVVQQYLDGPEFTIDVLCDFGGRPLSIVPRERVVIRAGVIDRGRTVRDERLIGFAQDVVTLLPCRGAINIQCRIVDGRPVAFEINPRFSGGIPLTIAAGADFPRMLVDMTLGRRVRPRIGEFRDNLWLTNYEASLFVDGRAAAAPGRRPVLTVGEVA